MVQECGGDVFIWWVYEVWPTEEQHNNITENRTESAHTDTDYVVTNPSAALSQA